MAKSSCVSRLSQFARVGRTKKSETERNVREVLFLFCSVFYRNIEVTVGGERF